MLFSSTEKNMLIGAFTAGAADMAFEAYYNYQLGAGKDPYTNKTDPLYWFYQSPNPWIPPAGDLIPLLGVPFLLWGLGKYRRNQRMREMGLGAIVYGVSEIIGWFSYKVVKVASGRPLSYRVVQGGIR